MHSDPAGLDLFMSCERPNERAYGPLPPGYRFRRCRPAELAAWKRLCLDDPQYLPIIDAYYDRVYAPQAAAFFERCLLACDQRDEPVGTLFIWRAYGRVNTLHWFRVAPEHREKGVGRALLTRALGALDAGDFPVSLHTHPGSYRAIKLYADLGFRLLTDPMVGYRRNGLTEGLPYLRAHMPASAFERLKTARAPAALLEAALLSEQEEF